MITQIVTDLNVPEGVIPSFHWGVSLHGVIMKELPTRIAAQLHEEDTRPYSQHIEIVNSSTIRWHVGILDQEVSQSIIRAVMGLTSVEISGRKITLSVAKTARHTVNKEEYIAGFLNAPAPDKLYSLRFVTPSTHKRAGVYVNFPAMDLIYYNLSTRFLAYSNSIDIGSRETVAALSGHTQITRYALRSAPYNLGSAVIQGYTGYMNVMLSGSDAMIRLGGLLLSLAGYMGIGVKTAMGMGGCKVTALGPPRMPEGRE